MDEWLNILGFGLPTQQAKKNPSSPTINVFSSEATDETPRPLVNSPVQLPEIALRQETPNQKAPQAEP